MALRFDPLAPGGGRGLWLLVLLAGCSARAGSEGSALEGPRTWQAEARAPAGVDLDLQPVSAGDLPADTSSVTVMVEGTAGEPLSLAVRGLGGEWLVDPQAPEESPNRVLRGLGRVVAMLPSATASLPLAANYLVAPAHLAGGRTAVTVSAWIKRGGTGTQELPLAVVVVGSVVDDGALDVALGELGRIWRAAGVEVREPARLRVEGDEAAALARVEVDAALGNDSPMVGQALSLSARAPADALTLVVVGDVAVAGPGYPIWALAGGVPVPPISGTPRSGVVVSAVLLRQDPVWAGQVMAHEMGHALGLYHTTEGALESAGGVPVSIGDPVDDSPACPASADVAPADGTLTARECDAYDAGNLMFWSPVRGATRLTGGQAGLAHRSALAR
jgi:hypothetical protein